tara:strand:- start:8716 stop:9513 length:798 start_codon:yes stop_codon:yes gene_type:complete
MDGELCGCQDVMVVKNLNRWFKEKWVDVSRTNKDGSHPPCGRSKANKSKRGYPKCRPSKRVSSKTPKLARHHSKGEKRAMTQRKRSKKQGVGGKPTMVKGDPIDMAWSVMKGKLRGRALRNAIEQKDELSRLPIHEGVPRRWTRGDMDKRKTATSRGGYRTTEQVPLGDSPSNNVWATALEDALEAYSKNYPRLANMNPNKLRRQLALYPHSHGRTNSDEMDAIADARKKGDAMTDKREAITGDYEQSALQAIADAQQAYDERFP